jgi:hypothetical protein
LHAAGGSLREIAEVLRLSHQRVHQIIDEAAQTVPALDRRGGDGDAARLRLDVAHRWRPKFKASVRPLVVVVMNVFVEHSRKMTPPRSASNPDTPAEASAPQRSANAPAFGAWTGVMMTRVPSLANTS